MKLPDLLSRQYAIPKGSEDLFDWYVNNSGHKGQNLTKDHIKDSKEYIALVTANGSTLQKEGSLENPIKAKRDKDKYWFNGQNNDEDLQDVKKWLKEGQKASRLQASTFDTVKRKFWNQFDRLLLNEDEIICFKDFCKPSGKFKLLICVPKAEVQKILKMYHSTESAGHMGVASTFANIRKTYYWPKMSLELPSLSGRFPVPW